MEADSPTDPNSKGGDTPVKCITKKCPKVKYKLVKLLPDKSGYRQYVNLKQDSTKPTHGREVELKAYIDKETSGITVYFRLRKHPNNKDSLPSRMKPLGLKPSMQCENSVVSATTNSKGIASVKMKLGTFGGDQFKAVASLKPSCKVSEEGIISNWITVWRRLWYQLTHHKDLTPPSMNTSVLNLKKIFIDFVKEPSVKHTKVANGKVIVGNHNATDYHKLHKNKHPEQSVHIVLCDKQIDGKDIASEKEVEFTSRTDYIEVAGKNQILIDPPLSGSKLFISGSWENIVTHEKGSLTNDATKVTRSTGLCIFNDKKHVKVTLPAEAKPSDKVKVTVKVNIASGPWGGDGGTAPHNLVKISSDDTVYTMCVMHELGHLMNMGPMSYSVNCPDGFEYTDHSKMYKSNGAHCYSGGSLVGGKGSGGTCIMYHQLNTSCTLKYCSLCSSFVKAMTLKKFKDLKK